MKEKSVSQTNVKIRNHPLQQKSHQIDNQLGSPLSKIRGTILVIDEGITSTKGSEVKKVNNDVQVFTHER